MCWDTVRRMGLSSGWRISCDSWFPRISRNRRSSWSWPSGARGEDIDLWLWRRSWRTAWTASEMRSVGYGTGMLTVGLKENMSSAGARDLRVVAIGGGAGLSTPLG